MDGVTVQTLCDPICLEINKIRKTLEDSSKDIDQKLSLVHESIQKMVDTSSEIGSDTASMPSASGQELAGSSDQGTGQKGSKGASGYTTAPEQQIVVIDIGKPENPRKRNPERPEVTPFEYYLMLNTHNEEDHGSLNDYIIEVITQWNQTPERNLATYRNDAQRFNNLFHMSPTE